MVASNGFEGEASGSSFSLVASVSIKGEGMARPESYWFDSSLYYDKLIKEGLGTKALERVMRKLGQKKVCFRQVSDGCGQYEFLRLLSPVIDALYGSSIQQKTLFCWIKSTRKYWVTN